MSQDTTYIIFSKNVDVNSTETFMNIVLNEVKSGKKHICVLISSPGGLVTSGISMYNFLKGIPIEISTHASGHASGDEIKAMIKEINPTKLIPIHTEHPELF